MSYKDFHGDSEIAINYGVNASIIYNHICFWIDHNKLKNKNFHDGSFWVFHSYTDFQNRYPFLTYDMIRTAITKLTEGCISHITNKVVPPLLKKGNYNKMKADKTIWYALIDESKVGLTYEKTEEDNLEDALSIEKIVKDDTSVSLEAQRHWVYSQRGSEQDLRDTGFKHSGVLNSQKKITKGLNPEQYSNELRSNKTASTCVREAGAASLQKIGFDRNTGEFVNGDELMPFFESKYKQRFESMQKSIEDVYFEACEVAKKIELRNAGAFLDSFFRDRAFPWIRNEAKKNHEKSLTEEILKQGRANYDLYCSFPYNNLLEFRDLHVKIKNRDSECYVYANPEVFQDFMYKAYSMNKEV